MPWVRIFPCISLLLLYPLAVFSQSPATTSPLNSVERNILTPSRGTLEQGENVAVTACASCHGAHGVSTEPGMPNLAGQRVVYLYRVLQNYQDRERRNDAMNRAIDFLNEEALLSVAAYYANLTPARPTPATESFQTPGDAGGDPFASIKEAMKKCVKCHGEDGNASASGMPNLTAQSPEYFVTSMQDYIDGRRDHKLMTRLAFDIPEEDLRAMGVFYAVQKPVRTETAGDGNIDIGREASKPCAACHGADGNASGADMPTLAGQDARYFVKAMEAYQDGKRQHEQMFEALDGLDSDTLTHLSSFYAIQEPVRRNVRKPLTTAEWIERCERCHGIDGNSTDPRYPMLAAQDRAYLQTALAAYADTRRSNTAMHAMTQPLSQDDLETIVEFYATREPKSVVYLKQPCEENADD